jgi:hypothetical protein
MMYSLKKRSTNNNRKRQQFRKRSVSPGESNRNRSPLKSPNYVSQIWNYILPFEVCIQAPRHCVLNGVLRGHLLGIKM